MLISDRQYRVPLQLTSNNIGVKHYLNAVAVPRANRQVERYNRTILDSLATMGANDADDKWDENVSNIQLGLNGTLNKAIGVAPSEALLGFRACLQGRMEVIDREPVHVTAARSSIEQQQVKYQTSQTQYFDKKRSKAHSYAEGDLVLIRVTSVPATGSSHKVLPKWRGPYRITKATGNDRYEVADIPGSSRSRIR